MFNYHSSSNPIILLLSSKNKKAREIIKNYGNRWMVSMEDEKYFHLESLGLKTKTIKLMKDYKKNKDYSIKISLADTFQKMELRKLNYDYFIENKKEDKYIKIYSNHNRAKSKSLINYE